MLSSKCGQAGDSAADRETGSDCSARSREERRLEIIELAREQREQEGAVEIDDNALLSEGNDNGCYAQAWVWVDFAGTRFDKEEHETD